MKRFVLPLLCILVSVQIWPFPGLTNEPGSHYDITQTALERCYGPSFGEVVKVRTVPLFGIERYEYVDPTLADIVCYASGGPDLYFFGHLPPHSQTEDYDYSVERTSAELESIEREALDAYFLYCSRILNFLNYKLLTEDYREAAYLFGFFLHTYHDLFSHRGITNSQHIYLNDRGTNPDYNEAYLAEARKETERFISIFPDHLPDPAARSAMLHILASSETVETLSPGEIRNLLRRSKDIYSEGIKYQFLTSGDKEAVRYMDSIMWDSAALLKIFTTAEGISLLLNYSLSPDPDRLLSFCGYVF
ncbi:MAG: hypothetical protein ACLFRY_05570 [Spirochaetia bacterium]